MNEIMTIGVNSIKSKELKASTRNILNIMAQNEKNSFKVAIEIQNIKANGLWKDDFQTMGEYTEKFFNLKQAQAYNLANVCERFFKMDEHGKYKTQTIYAEDKDDYTLTKLIRLTPVDGETINEWVTTGTLKPSMSVKEIEALVKDWQAAQKEEEVKEETADDIESKPEEEVDIERAVQAFTAAYETLKIITPEFNFDKLDNQIRIFLGYINVETVEG